MLNKIAESCHFLLNNYPDAYASKSYLDLRLSLDSQNKWEFGYFPNKQNISALTSLVGEDDLSKLELLSSNNIEDIAGPRRKIYNYFEDHPLIMPQRDAYGKVIALIGRTVSNNPFKYKNTKFKKGNHLFGLYENKKSILEQGCVYLVEGQFDVIKAVEIGFTNIVAMGSNNLSIYQLSLISRYCNNIFLLLDNDEAGQKGRARIVSKFGQLANIRNFYVPDPYKDIDEYITSEKISDYAELSFVVKD